jgi:NDP-sugar pyrophosphorylase family protein
LPTKAMIFAAGLGSRLRPLTDNLPKALIPVNQKPLLEHVILKLRSEGIEKVIINTHHFADKIESYLKENAYFDLDITLSHEKKLLDTGGGLKKAAWFFDDSPFIIHNVDVLSDISLSQLLNKQLEQDTLATLAVKHRRTTRYLLFDHAGWLTGRQANEQIFPAKPDWDMVDCQKYSFLGMHIVSPRIFRFFPEEDTFSILDLYLNAAATGEKISYVVPKHTYWYDLGRQENLVEAEQMLSKESD